MIGVGQLAAQHLGRRQDRTVALQHLGKHRRRIPVQRGIILIRPAAIRFRAQPGAFSHHPADPPELRGGPGAFTYVRRTGEAGHAVGVVRLAATGHGHVQPLPVAEAVDQDVGRVDSPALDGVRGGRIGQIAV